MRFSLESVFLRLEYPLERIERETHWEYREQWKDRLISAGIEGESYCSHSMDPKVFY